jgi:hypothetical protein
MEWIESNGGGGLFAQPGHGLRVIFHAVNRSSGGFLDVAAQGWPPAEGVMSTIMPPTTYQALVEDIEKTRVRERWWMNSSGYETLAVPRGESDLRFGVAAFNTRCCGLGRSPQSNATVGLQIAPCSRDGSDGSA